MNKLVLLDSNSLLHRAYHALPSLVNSKGQFTGAVYGFVSMLISLIEEEKPTHIAAAFDLHAPTFRHKMYKDYKATRKPMPEDLVSQVPIIKNLLKSMNIKIIELEGYEADDILGTMAERFNCPTLVITGDRDMLQLVSPTTHIYLTKKGIKDVVLYSEARLLEDGFTAQTYIDFKALQGDSSDNIPGIAGVGEVTAKTLITEYKTLENVLANAGNLKGKLAEKVSEGKEAALLAKKLVTIIKDVPVNCSLSEIEFKYPFSGECKKLLTDLEFSSLIKRLSFVEEKQEKIELKVKRIEIEELPDLKKTIDGLIGRRVSVVVDDYIYISENADTEYVVIPQANLFSGIPFEDVASELVRLLNSDGERIVFDKKSLLHQYKSYRMKLDGKVFDTMLLSHLVKGGKSITAFKPMLQAFNYEGKNPASEQLVLADELLKELNALGLDDLYYNIELPLVKVLFDMEDCGFTVDRAVLDELNKKYTAELNGLTESIYLEAGENFNINSPKQITNILFEKLQLPAKKKNKSGFSSNVDVLNDLIDVHPIIPMILRYRQLSKLQSTYIDGLVKLINKQGKIHTEFKQTVTSTGRLSSTEPNLQNIPTRTADGKEIRQAFVPSKGNILVSADYSQIELRLLAHFSGDEKLIEVYKNSEDIHTTTASQIFNVTPDKVTSEMRRNAKAVNFGIIYGISDFGLANNLSISPKKAKAFISQYFETYPRAKEYMNINVAYAREHGYVKTLSGRIRFLPEINSGNHNVKSFGERAAMNMPLQGTAADIVKIAMLRTAEALKDMKSKLILQVHDELIIDADLSELDKVKKLLEDAMENAVKLKVPLTVNLATGENWMVAK